MYRVTWKSRLTGATGSSKPSSDRDLVQSWVDFANEHYPELDHKLEYCDESPLFFSQERLEQTAIALFGPNET